ncbi:phosphoribosyl-ATP diphosphatase [Clostridium thailandense]|uniref:Phosphoribosyl-ATP pyrophosphatase n=1 Tax=Clostridium thailandense TaxID=2794346 RepID=A0A949WRX4_9CLOT|nr:phosphoribosyl-ATP diphosphatase [Clostridium thailandense]MBV7274461.1 phosphoribosyl-ATP diphosphatase [Clostridium thailandense]MCH5136647.1 phosphoribosyl-ATP diphosphatase [Clostridiaceae bacterium UIB06]
MELKNIVEQLYEVIQERKENPIEGSYTSYLFSEGIDKILKKIGEESAEVIIASKNNSKDEFVYETCDLIYHVLVLMACQGVVIDDIVKELEKRRQKICNKKPERKTAEGIH